MVQLTSTGEVAEFAQADQFQYANGKPLSQYECGFYSVYIARSMAPPGQTPKLTPAQIIAGAEAAYASYDGNNSASNTNGMTLPQLYELLAQVGLHYQATALDAATLHAWLDLGYPVIVAVLETSVYDLAMGDRSPYVWTPQGSHIILLTGNAGTNFLVRDSANVGSLSDPNSLRPGPRTYDAAKLQCISATVAVPPWLPRPTDGDPSHQPQPTPEDTMPILDISQVANYFTEINFQHWSRKDLPGVFLVLGHLQDYQSHGTEALSLFGLPTKSQYPALDANGKEIANTAIQEYERCTRIYDPGHVLDAPPYSGSVYSMHEDGTGSRVAPRFAQLEAQLTAAQQAAAGSTQGIGATCMTAVGEIKAIVDKITL